MFYHLSKKHTVEYTDFYHMDFFVDDKYYLKIMLFLDNNQINYLSDFLSINPSYIDKVYFICFQENEKYLKDLIKGCNTMIISKSLIEEYFEKKYIEYCGMRLEL